jgi:hypothetical protein
MSESKHPRIVFSERLSTGIVVHFENDMCVFFAAEFLYDQRNDESNIVFPENVDGHEDVDGDSPQQSQAAQAADATPLWKPATRIVSRDED